jgi:hypothetical protein|tara:strand:- start:1366 stop:2280 length:915 start_codon:yes stop_codon:yes gene_type:complete
MAINVDKVYKTVLLIINKEQRGYLTPDEFNKIATQVQLEIFESYFETLNQQMRLPQNESEYGDRYKTVQEKLDIFKVLGNATYVASNPNYFNTPNSGVASGTQTFATVNNQTAYTLTTITQAQVEDSNVIVTLDGVAYTNYNITGGTFNLTAGSIAAGSTLLITLYPQDFYKLGTVLYKDDKEVQCVERNELAQMNMSTITKPSEYFPVYVYEDKKIIIYPQTINSNVSVTYVRKPSDVMWNFTSPTGYYVWDPTTSVDFELDVSEQSTVILEVLKYAGVTIKDPAIVQAAAQELAANEINEKQ